MEQKWTWLGVMLACVSLVGCKTTLQSACIPIIGVYPAWNTQALAVDDIPWNRLTHLAVVFAIPDKEGNLITTEVDPVLARLAQNKQAATKKIVVSIGGANGYGDAFQVITRDKTKQQKFVRAIADYAVKHKLAGIDIDWEYWTKQDVQGESGNDPVESQQLVGLLAELRAVLPASVQLSVSVFPGYWKGEQYLPELQQYVDYVVLMAFDATGQWPESDIGHHSEYYVVSKGSALLWERGFLREKTVIATPMYGIEFIDGKKTQVKSHAYNTLPPVIGGDLAAINRGKFQHIYYETPELIQKKSQYILDEGLAGIVFFELTQDAAAANTSLIAASNNIISPDFCKH